MDDFSKLFQAISDEKRRRILWLLEKRDYCVNDLVDMFHLSQSSISKHLTVLKNAGLVSDKRNGQHVYYSLNSENLKSCCREYFKRFECCHCLFATEKDESQNAKSLANGG